MGGFSAFTGLDEDDEDQPQPARIARPSPASPIPPVTLRGVNAPTASPAPDPGSTEAPESRGLASHITPRSIAAPSPLESRTSADQAELSRLQSTGSGVSQIAKAHPIAGGVLRGLNIAGEIGSAVLPQARTALMSIPGTEEHHNFLIRQQQGKIGEDLGEQDKEAGTAKTQADTSEAEARANLAQAQADVAKNPKQGLTPEETTIHDLMTGENGQPRINPQTKQPYTYFDAYSAVMQAKQDTKPDKTPPVGDASAKQYNDSILRELNVNPKTAQKAIPPEYQVAATDTDAQAKEKLQRAKDLVSGATGQQRIVVGEGNQNNNRADRSYQFNSTQLEKLRAPIEQRMDRMSTLNANLNLKSPQADAVLAPEILSISAGGQGSGLRMNEAEISRIVGGSTKWTQLQTAVNKWSTDPKHATFTDEQRGQMFAIAKVSADKYQKKLDILNDAEQALLESNDPAQHRAITAKAKKDLDAVDKAINDENAGAPERPSNVPASYVYQKNGPKGEGWYKP